MSRISKLINRDSRPVKFVQPKVFIPVDCQIPDTPKTIMARTMLQSGLISRDDYDKMLGVEFDTRSEAEESFDDDDDFADYNDDYVISSFSEYEQELDYAKEEEKSQAQSESIAQPDPSVEQSETDGGSAAE